MTLEHVLGRARDLGFLGPGPVGAHIEHALAFERAVGGAPALAVDLGTGGGVPSLVLARVWPASRWALVEVMHRRAEFLRAAVAELGWDDRIAVEERRAELVGRDPVWRASAALVTARGFGPPAVTAECAAPLLATGGVLVVSEPPTDESTRWDPGALHELGLGAPSIIDTGARMAVFTQDRPCPATFPRRVGVPAKRPLW